MPEGDETRERGFKIVDKRTRDEEEAEEAQATSQASAKVAEGGAQRAESERPQQRDLPAIDFSTFVVSLATSALFYLGKVEDPETGQPPEPNLPMARQTIDTLGILQEKTVGNLEPEEEKLLQTLLYDLRMHFVQGTR